MASKAFVLPPILLTVCGLKYKASNSSVGSKNTVYASFALTELTKFEKVVLKLFASNSLISDVPTTT